MLGTLWLRVLARNRVEESAERSRRGSDMKGIRREREERGGWKRLSP